jgi:hypothetical protein
LLQSKPSLFDIVGFFGIETIAWVYGCQVENSFESLTDLPPLDALEARSAPWGREWRRKHFPLFPPNCVPQRPPREDLVCKSGLKLG